MKILYAFLFVFTVTGSFAQDSLHMTKLGHLDYTPSLNDVWGYVDATGKEYALVGARTGFSVVDISIPSSPDEKVFISGAYSTWRDIKTYSHYAYVVHDSYSGPIADGLMIVDLDSIDAPTPRVVRRYPGIPLNGTTHIMTTAHNIYIDENGILYVFGADVSNGGALMFDLKPDPENPTYLGAYDQYYLHDGMVRGDTLWGGAVYEGFFIAVDVANKANPVPLASHITPNAFTHNCWISDDNKTLYTTDEISGAYIGAYDVSDLNNIDEFDRIQISYGGNDVIPHNAFVLGDFVVTSYYTSGVQIVDATIPQVLLETAYYDTSPLSGNGYNGAWGVYPYLPSGNILVSDVQEGLFILSSSFPRGCYFTGLVKDSVTGNSIPNATVEVINSPLGQLNTDIFGNFYSATLTTGVFQAAFHKAGYQSDTLTISLTNGVEEHKEVALLPVGFSVNEAASREISITPNPAGDHFKIDLSAISGSYAVLEIVNINGQKVFEKEIDLSQAAVQVAPRLKAGFYLVRITSPEMDIRPVKLIINK